MKKSILFLFLLAGVIFFLSTAEKPADLKPSFNHLALSVYDLPKTGEFYEKVMNLRKIEDPFKDKKHIWFHLGEHSQLHLIAGGAKDQVHSKDSHLSLTVSSVEEFVEHLKTSGISLPNGGVPGTRADGIKQIFFQDPDGFWVEVNNDRY